MRAVALEPMDIAAGWQLQDAANVTPGGNEISLPVITRGLAPGDGARNGVDQPRQ